MPILTTISIQDLRFYYMYIQVVLYYVVNFTSFIIDRSDKGMEMQQLLHWNSVKLRFMEHRINKLK